MKLTALFALALSFAAIADDKPATINQRKKNQQARIKEGRQSGQLTAKETAKLQKEEAELRRQLREDRRDGRGLTPKERAKTQARLDEISRKIYNQKHDAQTRQ